MTTARSSRWIAHDRDGNGDVRLFTRREYHRMAESGVLKPDDRVELLRGSVMMMSPLGPRHAGVLGCLAHTFTERLAGRALCWVQMPLAIGEHSEPQPDLMLLEPRADFYQSDHPGPRQVFLLIEVAETSLHVDRTSKQHLYAEAGVREYWIVDLGRARLIVHRDPTGDRYATVTEHDRHAPVAPLAFPDCPLRLAAVIR